jgi:hypothetical protein
VDTASRAARQHIGSHTLWTDAVRGREREQVAHAIVAALGYPQLFHTSGAESLDDGVDAVNDHDACRLSALDSG